MLPEKIEQFCEIVVRDDSLHERFRRITERADFVRTVAEIGAEHGFEFTTEEIEEAMRRARRVWLEKWK